MGADDLARRILERSLAAALLLLAVPLIALTATVSFACYRAWPFFVQDRVGLGGRTLRFVKVRSLPPDTARYADKYSLEASRIPAVMRTVRRLHLDELPQLLHVVRGEMAFVGPRPEMPNLHAELPEPFATERVSVRPGITGLWQISPHCHQLIGERTEYDRLYIWHRTPAFDAWILLRTLRKMTLGRMTQLYEVPQRLVRDTPAPAPVFAPIVLTERPVPLLDAPRVDPGPATPAMAAAGNGD